MNREYVVYVAGGLANKMFHISFGFHLQEKGYKVYFDDFSASAEFEHDILSINKIFPQFEMERMPFGLYKYGGLNTFKGKILRRLPIFTKEKYVIAHGFDYNVDFVNNLPSKAYIIGPFQDERYFPKDKNILRRNFIFAEFEDNRNLDLQKEMEECNSIAIHIRKGDGYKTWPQFVGTCGKDYYENAIKYFMDRVINPKFYVFTDEPTVAKEYLNCINYKLIDWNPAVGYGNHFDMQLMASAKNNIIANSTYSWWAAWLNKHNNKIVIGPQKWFNLTSDIKRQPEIIPNNWVKL